MSDILDALDHHPRLFVLTGAGISLASGIPTYRDSHGRWTASQPIQHGDFVRDAAVRQRYWARSMVGWRHVGTAQPTDAHRALAELEQLGRVALLVTQNVDRLHQRAGSDAVVDLHGRLDQVICLACGDLSQRADLQPRLQADNGAAADEEGTRRPDGDADVPDALVARMRVPACERCGGVLKPHVVFFGDNVPRERVARCQRALSDADALLVVGSSLQVYSGYRFCRQAAEQGTPIYSINPGRTRADALLSARSEEPADAVLSRWLQRVRAGGAAD